MFVIVPIFQVLCLKMQLIAACRSFSQVNGTEVPECGHYASHKVQTCNLFLVRENVFAYRVPISPIELGKCCRRINVIFTNGPGEPLDLLCLSLCVGLIILSKCFVGEFLL